MIHQESVLFKTSIHVQLATSNSRIKHILLVKVKDILLKAHLKGKISQNTR